MSSFQGVQGSSGSSVISWLSAHPDSPRGYNHITEPSTRTSKRLHKQKDQENKRHKLGEMSHNTRGQRPRRDGARNADNESASGNLNTPRTSKRRTRITEMQEATESPSTPATQRSMPPTSLDDDPAPKPKSVGVIPEQDPLWLPPILEPRRSSPARPASKVSSSSHDSASRSTTRSRSPTKKLGDFQLSDMRVKMISIGAYGYSLPKSVRDLHQDLKAISKGRGVIPMAVKDKALAELDDLVDDWNFGPSDRQDAEKLATRCSLSHHALWERVHEILDAAIECKDEGLPEPSWNSEVHSSLLRLALRGWWQSKDVWYRDITTAKIHDASLLPTMATGATMQSKMVDYALVLKQPPDLDERITNTLHAENRPSINHTKMEAVRFSPIAVSIETKRGAVDEDTAFVQLGTWVSAHFAHLRQLTHDNGPTQLPVLPLVLVQGSDWKLMFAEAKEGADKDKQQTLIFSHVRLGETTSVLGIYQVIEAVRRLARWVDEDYRPWFEREVLAMTE
jgi:hypothetical protein